MEEFIRSTDWEKRAARLINEDQLLILQHAMDVKVVCVLSETKKLDKHKNPVYAEAEKIPAQYF